MTETKKIDCFKCRHYYVTWDEFFPKGCKALGFKSREAPSLVVRSSSGMECMRFEEKEKVKKGKK